MSQHLGAASQYVSPCPKPTAHQAEVGQVLIEECAEINLECLDIIRQCNLVQQRVTKALRFGIGEIQPGQPHGNAYRLGLEVGDLLTILEFAVKSGLVSEEAIEAGKVNKRKQLARFMQTALDEPANEACG